MSETPPAQQIHQRRDTTALALLLASSFMFVLMALLIKLLDGAIHIAQLLLIRQAVMLVCLVPLLVRTGPPSVLRTAVPGWQAARVGCAAVGMVCTFSAVVYLPLADVTAIGFSKVFFVAGIAVLLLRETVTGLRWVCIAAGLAGVAVMLEPGWTALTIFGLVALLGAAAEGAVMVIVRRVSQVDSAATIILIQVLGIAALMIVPALIFWVWPTPQQWGLLVGVGVASFLVQRTLVASYGRAEASWLAPFEYSRLLFAVTLGFVAFGSLPGWNSLLGAAIIVGASIVVLLPGQRSARDKSRVRT